MLSLPLSALILSCSFSLNSLPINILLYFNGKGPFELDRLCSRVICINNIDRRRVVQISHHIRCVKNHGFSEGNGNQFLIYPAYQIVLLYFIGFTARCNDKRPVLPAEGEQWGFTCQMIFVLENSNSILIGYCIFLIVAQNEICD